MQLPLLDPAIVYRHVHYEFLMIPPIGNSGFKTVSVAPLDDETCALIIDLDGKGTENSVVRVRVEHQKALKISTYVLQQPLMDIITTKREKKDDEAQH